jgi:heat-inducible transcriptional repressor
MKKTFFPKRTKKEDREIKVLFGLIELFIETAKPVGSHTLQERGFADLSSATIRNYCSKLEDMGYLTQQHSSGGRIPTELAFSLYAEFCLSEPKNSFKFDTLSSKEFMRLSQYQSSEPALYLSLALETLSKITNLACFASSPRFDNDFISNIKLVAIDTTRVIAIILTNLGLIQTETINVEKKLSAFTLKRIENYFSNRINPSSYQYISMNQEEEKLAQFFYHEIMIRYIAKHVNFTEADIFHTGFSCLLNYPELSDPQLLASSLSLFENKYELANLLKDTMKKKMLALYLGENLKKYTRATTPALVISAPYFLNQTAAGSIAVIGPMRVSYKKIINTLKVISSILSQNLTHSMYKFKIHYRKPQSGMKTHLDFEQQLFLEDKSKEK